MSKHRPSFTVLSSQFSGSWSYSDLGKRCKQFQKQKRFLKAPCISHSFALLPSLSPPSMHVSVPLCVYAVSPARRHSACQSLGQSGCQHRGHWLSSGLTAFCTDSLSLKCAHCAVGVIDSLLLASRQLSSASLFDYM